MDATTIRLVVGILGGAGIACVVGMVGLSAFGQKPPDALISIAGSAFGALVGILVQAQQPPRPGRGQ